MISQPRFWRLALAHNGRQNDPLQTGGAGGRRGWQDGPDNPGGFPLPAAPDTLANPRQLCLNHFVETYDPTIEDSYRKQVVIDGHSCMLEVLDTAGQEEYTALRDQWIRDGEGFVLVYSISSRSSFTRIQRFHHQINRVKESSSGSSYAGSPLNSPASLSSSSGAPVPVMLVGNKSDRVTEREVSTQEGHALAKELGCEFVEASAKSCVNVEKAFYDVVRLLRKQRSRQSPYAPPPGPRNTRDDYDRPLRKGLGHRKHPKCVIL